MELSNQLFKVLDDYVDKCNLEYSPENQLIDGYFDIWEGLKQRVGSSAGYTGVSEYLFFQYILKKISHLTGESFEPIKRTKYTYIFQSKKFTMTHDVDIANYLEDVNNQRTDIAIFSNDGDTPKRLLGAFEIKIYVTSKDIISNMINRFENLGAQTNSYLFGVFFYKMYVDKFEEFCKRYSGRASIISKESCSYKVSLGDAVKKIIS